MNKYGVGFKKSNLGLFIGGAIFSIVARNFMKSKTCKNICIQTLAKGLSFKDDVEHAIAVIKEEAEDVYNEARLSGGESSCHLEMNIKE